MCEKRSKKVKKGSSIIRLREARRLQRLQPLAAPAAPAPLAPPAARPCVDRSAQSRVLLQLALKTVELMKKNTIIQQKIAALQKETSEFVASVMSNPENKRRCIEYLKTNGLMPKSDAVPPLPVLG